MEGVVKEIPLKAVSPRRLSEDIIRQLENLILNNELKIGDALPPERELAVRLKVSRNILREAISVLVQKGLLEVHHGAGTFVARPSVEFLRDSLEFFVRLNDSGFHDLLEARDGLEAQIAELAAKRATEEDIELIEECLRSLETVVDDPERYIEGDILFHSALAKVARNEILQLLLNSIRGAMRENIRLLLMKHPTAVSDAMHYHHKIAQAVREHDPAEARNTMREHLESVGRSLKELQTQTDKRKETL